MSSHPTPTVELETARRALISSNKLSEDYVRAIMEQIDSNGYDSLG